MSQLAAEHEGPRSGNPSLETKRGGRRGETQRALRGGRKGVRDEEQTNQAPMGQLNAKATVAKSHRTRLG